MLHIYRGGNAVSYSVNMTPDGAMIIPAALREQLGFKDGERLVLENDGDGFTVKSYRQVVREVQAEFKRMLKGREFTVDDFIAERRLEAAREEAELNDNS
jgi:AbrB family transcriptional regulator (stage V sporulation protein T)